MVKLTPGAGAGVLTVMVPVATVQVGCVGVAVGWAGTNGAGLMVILLDGDIQPAPFLTVTLYVLGARPGKMPVVFV